VLGLNPSGFRSLCSKPVFPKRKEKPCIKYSSTLLSFLQKARTVRNAKRHFAFGEKTFALSAYAKASAERRVRVALMNIWVVIKNQMLYNVGKCWIWYYIKKRGSIMLLKGYLTVEQVAEQLGLSEYRIRELIREKKIRAVKIGQWRIKPEDLKSFIESRKNIR